MLSKNLNFVFILMNLGKMMCFNLGGGNLKCMKSLACVDEILQVLVRLTIHLPLTAKVFLQLYITYCGHFTYLSEIFKNNY